MEKYGSYDTNSNNVSATDTTASTNNANSNFENIAPKFQPINQNFINFRNDYYSKERNRLKKRRTTWIILTIVGSLLGLAPYVALVWIFLFPLAVRNFTCNCKDYFINNHHIFVYAGHLCFYIKIDGIEVCKVVRYALFTKTKLHATMNDGSILDVRITPSFKRIRLECNGQFIPFIG